MFLLREVMETIFSVEDCIENLSAMTGGMIDNLVRGNGAKAESVERIDRTS